MLIVQVYYTIFCGNLQVKICKIANDLSIQPVLHHKGGDGGYQQQGGAVGTELGGAVQK